MPVKNIHDMELCAYCAENIGTAYELRKIAENKTRTKCSNCGKLRWGARYELTGRKKHGKTPVF